MNSLLKLIKYSFITGLVIFVLFVGYGVALKFNLIESEPPTPNELKFRQCLSSAVSFDEAEQCIKVYSNEIDEEESVTIEKAISNAEQEVTKIEKSIDAAEVQNSNEPVSQTPVQ